jgi:DNA uptake protein ComE-like DNA-binding protein
MTSLRRAVGGSEGGASMSKRTVRRVAVVVLSLVTLAWAATAFTQSTDRIELAAKKKAPVAESAVGKVDINSASKEDLAKLPVIGDVIAGKIIAGRPYATKRDLLTKKILTAKQYAKVKDLIIAKQP